MVTVRLSVQLFELDVLNTSRAVHIMVIYELDPGILHYLIQDFRYDINIYI